MADIERRVSIEQERHLYDEHQRATNEIVHRESIRMERQGIPVGTIEEFMKQIRDKAMDEYTESIQYLRKHGKVQGQWVARDVPAEATLEGMTRNQPISEAECRIVQEVLMKGGCVDEAEAAVYSSRGQLAPHSPRAEIAMQHARMTQEMNAAKAAHDRAKAEMYRVAYGGGRQTGKTALNDEYMARYGVQNTRPVQGEVVITSDKPESRLHEKTQPSFIRKLFGSKKV